VQARAYTNPPVATIPAGPLAVRWHGCELGVARAGAFFDARVTLENAGTAAWKTVGDHRIEAAYHWLDRRGNPIVWDGFWHPFGRVLGPGDRMELPMRVRAPIPPGRYVLAFDLVSAGSFWFAEIGNGTLEVEVDVLPRIERRALAVRGAELPGFAAERDADAVATLSDGAEPAPDWAARVLDAHAEGYAVVGGSVEVVAGRFERRKRARELAAWAPGAGRVPGFAHPLVFPSVLAGVDVEWTEVAGLPAAIPPRDESWIYDGRAVVRARSRSGRRRD
jgi:hypothetical protein